MTDTRQKIWLDCDPGIDDGITMGYIAANRDKFNLLGISTVAGNQTMDRVGRNALGLAKLFGLEDVPVFEGAKKPLIREIKVAEHVHGSTGVGNTVLDTGGVEFAKGNYIEEMAKILMEQGEKEVILIPTAPLTNIALLLKIHPEVKSRISKIVLMGGAASGGNATPAAEFNIWVDPEAAQMVYGDELPIIMCGLDVTMKCGLTKEQIKDLTASQNHIIKTMGEMLTFYNDSIAYKGKELTCIHDVATTIYLTHPQLFKGEQVGVEVDCTKDINRGRTVCDRRAFGRPEKENVLLLTDVDAEKFQEVLLDSLYSFGE